MTRKVFEIVPETPRLAKISSIADKITSLKCESSRFLKALTIVTLVFINMLNYMDRYTISAVVEPLKLYFNVEDAEIGLSQTIFICAYMFSSPLFGYLGDRYSRKFLILSGMCLWTGSVLISTFMPPTSLVAFMACRGVLGIGLSSYVNVAPTLIADLYTADSRTRVLMIFYFAIPVGSGLGFLIGGTFASQFGSWQWGIRATTFGSSLAILLVSVLIKDIPRGQADKALNVTSSTWKGYWRDIKAQGKCPSFVWATLGNSCVAFGSGALSLWAPTLVTRSEKMLNRDTSGSSITTLFGIITVLAGFAGVALGTTVAQRWRRKNPRADALVCAIGMLISGPTAYIVINIVHINIHLAWILMFVTVTTMSFNWALVPDIVMYVSAPDKRATANALCTFFQHFLGGALSTYVVGQLSESLNSGEKSLVKSYKTLMYAMYVLPFVLVIGGFCFLICALYLEKDKLKAEMELRAPAVRKNAIVPAKFVEDTVVVTKF